MRVIIVHSMEDCLAALEAAGRMRMPVTLQTAPDAVRYAGMAYLEKMFEFAQEQYPDVMATCIIDCGDDAALATEAVKRRGWKVRFTGTEKLWNSLRDIAMQCGTALVRGEFDFLDLVRVADARQAVEMWLRRQAEV